MRFIVHLLVHIDDGIAVEIGQCANVISHLLGNQLIIFLLLRAHHGGEIEIHREDRRRKHQHGQSREPEFTGT